MWFPKMNNYVDNHADPDYSHIWGWMPKHQPIKADTTRLFVHLENVAPVNDTILETFPNCLLHYSWKQDTIKQKVQRYNDIGLPMIEPLIAESYGKPEPILEWMRLE